MSKELQLLKSLGLEAKEAARIVYSGNEALERYLIKNNKYLSRALPDLKKIKKGLDATTKVATEVKEALPDLKKISKTAKETADKAKQVANTAKEVGGKAKEVTDLLKQGDFGKVNKNLGKGVSGGAVAMGLAGGAIVVGGIAIKFQGEVNDIVFSQLEQKGNELGTQLKLIVKHDVLLKNHQKQFNVLYKNYDALSADYDVLSGYQGDLTRRLNNNERDFTFLKQETTQQLNALSEVIRVSNINSYNNDLKLQNQILELAEKIKGIKAGTPGNNLILDLVNAKLTIINEAISKNERLNQSERDSIKKEIKSLNDKIPSNNQGNNNQSNSNSFNPSQLWQAINTNKTYTANALNNSKEALNQLKPLKLSDSKQEKRLEFLEKDLPRKFEAKRQFEVQTEKEFKEQKKINENQKKDINNVKTDISNVKTDVSNVKESNELVATSVKIVDGKIESVKYTKLDKADYENGIKIVDGKIEPLKKASKKNRVRY